MNRLKRFLVWHMWLEHVLWYFFHSGPWLVLWVVGIQIVGWHMLWISLAFVCVHGWENGVGPIRKGYFDYRKSICRTPDCRRKVEPLEGRIKCCITCTTTEGLRDVHLSWCEMRNGTHHSQGVK